MQGKSSPQVRRAVLGLVLYLHPEHVSPERLGEDFGGEAQAAIAVLEADGLLRREGKTVRPTRAALSFHRLNLP